MNLDTKIKSQIIGLEIGKINVIKTTEFNVHAIANELSDILGQENIQIFKVGTHTGISIPEIVKQFGNFDYTKPIIIVTNKDAIYKHIIPRNGKVIGSKCPKTGFLILNDVKWQFTRFQSTFESTITQLRRDYQLERIID
jgi:hypothetical protein